ncbi:hypothetical protein [Flavobacterium beibuense]|uniref:hypothetical protein n=1 Tax=Flavobacterium beibuense TaxID=657326 RepID=UPI003A8F6BF3
MKKFIYGLLGFAAISLTSCDYHDPNSDKFGNDSSTGWVQFDSEGTTYASAVPGAESTITASIPVVIKSLDLINLGNNPFTNNPVNEGLTIYYTVEDIDGSSSYLNIPGSVYLPKGELTANITFTVPASAQISCSQFRVTLTSTSNPNVTVGFEEHDLPTQDFVVGALSLDAYVGNYSVLHTFADNTQASYTCSIATGTEENSLVITGLYNSPNPITFYVNNDGTIRFPEYIENYLLTQGGVDYFVDGDGGYVSCFNGGTVSANFSVVSTSGTGGDENVVLTKN